MKINKKQKGFTLIELLVVIAIIAILAVVVVLTLNPAELLRQARDSNRVSDFATLKSAIGLYAADVSSPSFTPTNGVIYISQQTGTPLTTSTLNGTSSATNWGFATADTVNATFTSTVYRNVDATGWIPVAFNKISSGAPVGSLPVDPTNNASYTYAYVGNNASSTYKLAAKMESTKYGNSGSGDVVSTDGGPSTSTYEQGTNLAL